MRIHTPVSPNLPENLEIANHTSAETHPNNSNRSVPTPLCSPQLRGGGGGGGGGGRRHGGYLEFLGLGGDDLHHDEDFSHECASRYELERALFELIYM